MARTAGMSSARSPRPSAYVNSFSTKWPTDEELRLACQRGAQPGHAVHARAVGKHIARVDSRAVFGDRSPAAHGVEVLQREADRVHQLVAAAHAARWRGGAPSARASCAVAAPAGGSSSAGTSGGGAGGGAPSRLSRTHFPRSTGDVVVACDVTSRIAPLPSRPRRASSAAVTRRNRSPSRRASRSAGPGARSRTCSRRSADR